MDALRAVLRELHGCLHDLSLTRKCCQEVAIILDALCKPDCIEAAREGAAIKAMLAAAAAHPGDAEVQESTWSVFEQLLHCAPESETGAAAGACQRGALHAAVRALHMQVDVVRVCHVLCLLAYRHDANVASVLGDMGAVEAAAAALRQSGRPDAVFSLTELLYKLLMQHPTNCARAFQADVMEAVTAAIRMHVSRVSSSFIYPGFGVLSILYQYDDGTFSSRAAAANVIDLAIGSLHGDASDDFDEGRDAACVLLCNMANTEAGARKIVAEDGIAAILAALRVRPAASDDVLHASFGVYWNCCLRAPELISTLVAAGVVEAIVSALQARPNAAGAMLLVGYSVLDKVTAMDSLAIERALKAGALRLPRTDHKEAGLRRDVLFRQLNDAVAAADARADAAMAELLSEEAAAKAASGAASKKRRGKAKKADDAHGAGGAEDAPPHAVRGAEGGAAPAAEQPAPLLPAGPPPAPSAAAERRRRRAATKAARRCGAAASAAPAAAAAAAATSSDDDILNDEAGGGGGDAAAEAKQAPPPPLSEQPLEAVFPFLSVSNASLPGASPPLLPQLPPLPRAPWDAAPPAVPAPNAQDARLAALEAQLAAKDAALAALKAEADAAPKCAICLDAPPCVVLLPCRHQPLCGSAACAAMLGAPPLCPLCRKPVADTLHTFV